MTRESNRSCRAFTHGAIRLLSSLHVGMAEQLGYFFERNASTQPFNRGCVSQAMRCKLSVLAEGRPEQGAEVMLPIGDRGCFQPVAGPEEVLVTVHNCEDLSRNIRRQRNRNGSPGLLPGGALSLA